MYAKFNVISFCRETYKERCGYSEEINEIKMFDDIASFIQVALKNGYQMRIWDDGMTVVIEYNCQDESLGGVSLEWVGEDEYVEKCAGGEIETE